MQAFCFLREFLERLRNDGPIFRSPFPDYYLANVAFARARSIAIIPEALGIAGVTKASFGYTLFNELEEQGAKLLNYELSSDPLYSEVEKYLLPGPSYDTSYMLTMEHVARYVSTFTRRGVSYGRYRRLQVFKMLDTNGGHLRRGTPAGSLLWSRLSITERIWTMGLSALIKAGRRVGLYQTSVLPRLTRLLDQYAYVAPVKTISRGQYPQLVDFFKSLKAVAFDASTSLDETPLANHGKDSHSGTNSIAVVYLARMQEGREPLQRFAASYVKNPAGTSCDLAVVYKGFDRTASLNEAKETFRGNSPHSY